MSYGDEWSKCAECGEPTDYCQGHSDIYGACPWCQEEETDEPDTNKLCRLHLAEYEGLSVDELDRMEDEQAAELL